MENSLLTPLSSIYVDGKYRTLVTFVHPSGMENSLS